MVGCVANATYAAAILWAAIAACSAAVLARRRMRQVRLERAEQAAHDAAIAARADAQNEAYLDGDTTGLYGKYRPTDPI
ncbi:hypothetical protein A6F56_04485 [Prescottella equi]|nr:hypothetical protein A6F56_04485 [Prescottella equi]